MANLSETQKAAEIEANKLIENANSQEWLMNANNCFGPKEEDTDKLEDHVVNDNRQMARDAMRLILNAQLICEENNLPNDLPVCRAIAEIMKVPNIEELISEAKAGYDKK